MKVKIGNEIYDAESQPIMLIFEDDKERELVAKHISDMPNAESVTTVRKYCVSPNNIPADEIREFMKL